MTIVPESNTPIKSVMGFDFGTQKMGVAIGQSLTNTAKPLPLIVMKDGIPDWEILIALIEAWRPDVCIVGLPLNMDDSENELCLRARKFARRLKHRQLLPVFMVDERLTTREARQELNQIQQNRRGKLPSADSLAAVALVESWLAVPFGVLP